MLTTEQLNRLQNFGFTSQSAAIVDVLWFTQAIGPQAAIVLICNPEGVWKAYLGTPITEKTTEDFQARQVAEYGAKVPYAITKAAFPERPFDNLNYDLGEVQVRG